MSSSKWEAFWQQPHVVQVSTTVVLLDGLYHLLASQRLFERTAPDYQMSRAVCGPGARGLPLWMHRLMGAVLIVGSLAVRTQPQTGFARLFQTAITPFALGIIATGLLLHLRAFLRQW